MSRRLLTVFLPRATPDRALALRAIRHCTSNKHDIEKCHRKIERGSYPFFRNFEVPLAGTGPELDAEVSRCSVPGRSRFSFSLRRSAPHTDKRFVRPASKKEVHQFKNRNRKSRKEITYGKSVRTR